MPHVAQCCELIIDSCSDLPAALRAQESVRLVDFNYIIDDVVYPDDFFESINAKSFYADMREGAVSRTTQPTQADYETVFREIAEAGSSAVYLAFSSGLSGGCDGAMLALDRVKLFYPDCDIYVVDTLLGSTPEGLLVSEALRQRDRGLSAAELAAWALEARFYVHTLFMVEDLEALRRGGRIPATVALAGAKLDVKPLLSFDVSGKLALAGVARGRKKGLRQMADYFVKSHDNGAFSSVAAIGNADCAKDAERLRELISKADGHVEFLESSIGPTIGSHVGPDMVSLCFWGPDRREARSVADRIASRVRQHK